MKQRLDIFVRDCHGMAEAGHPESQYDLGILFSTGKGVPLDYVIAHKWFNLAAAGIREARALRAALASQMPLEDVAEALRLAREWLRARALRPQRPRQNWSRLRPNSSAAAGDGDSARWTVTVIGRFFCGPGHCPFIGGAGRAI